MSDVNPFSPTTEQEKKLLTRIVRPDMTVGMAIPDKIDATQYWDTLETVGHQIGKSMAQTQVLLPVLGRLLKIAKDDPENTYKAKGIKSQEKFLDLIEKEFGVSRQTCFEARMLYQRWGDVATRDFAAIGRVNFQILNKAIARGEETQPHALKLIEAAKKSESVEAFEALVVKKGLLERGEAKGASINIQTSKKIARQWKKFYETPEIQAVVGSERPDRILEAMMQECEAEWLNQGGEKLKEQAAAESASGSTAVQ